MMRRALTAALMLTLVATWPAADVRAQTNPKDTTFVVGEGAGMYVQAAAPSLVGAFDRAIGELDASPSDATPKQVKDASFRRRLLELRLLELRLLMDLNAYAYDRGLMQGYREIVDIAYEGIGIYQDIVDFEKELGTTVAPEIVANRQVEMNEALASIRNGNVRAAMRQFLASPLRVPRTGGGPGLWDLNGSRPSNSFDAAGNAALFQLGIVEFLQGADLGVMDIFDPDQALHLHDIRKEMRSVVLLVAMFPSTSEATRDVMAPLVELVGDYGDVLEAYNSYTFAQQTGMDTEKVEAELRREFERAQMIKDQFIETHALDAVAIRLNAVRDAHRR